MFCAALIACNAGPKNLAQEEDAAPAPQPKATPNWDYRTEAGATWACAKSVDNAAELCFRREQGHLDSFLHLPKSGNPFFCSRGRCPTKIQVDSATPETVQGTDDENGGVRILFLPDPQHLLREIGQSKQVHIKPPMFGVDQEFVFNVDGLNWK